MSTIVTRVGKGTALTWEEADANFTNLNVDKVEYANLAASGGSTLVGYMPIGAGAVATDVQSKFRESISDGDFGLVGDGVTDDSDAFIALLAAAVGKTVALRPSANYLITKLITIPDDVILAGNSSTITVSRIEASNNSLISVGNRCVVSDLNIHLPSGAYAHRVLTFQSDCVGTNLKITSVDQIDIGDDNQDGCLRVVGANTSLSGIHIENFDRGVLIYTSTNTSVENYYCKSYAVGLRISSSSITRLSSLVFNGKSPNATATAGHNAILGGGEFLSISDVQIRETGEHAIYLTNDVETSSLSLSNININQCGQSGIKLRNWHAVNIANVSVIDCAYNNSIGANEDGLRLEKCRNVVVSGYRVGSNVKGNSCNAGIYVDGVVDLQVDGFFASNPNSAVVYVTDANLVVNERLYFNGVGVGGITNSKPLIQVVTTGGLGTLIATGLYGSVKGVRAIQLTVGGVASGEYLFEGSITGDLPPLLNSSTITGIKTFMKMNGIASEFDGSFVFRQIGNSDTGATATEGSKGVMTLITSGGTQAENNLGAGIAFGAINGDRRKAMVSTKQIGPNANQTGIAIFGYSGTTSSVDSVVESACFTSSSIRSGADNSRALGEATYRWSVVYAGTGAINTSDGREKQQLRTLSEAEHVVAVKLKSLLKAFKFNDSVLKKGNGARIHFGVIAQDVVSAFAAEGLDANKYALLCYDEWTESSRPVVDAEGNETGEREIIPAGNRYGIRYEELLAFMMAAL